MQNSIRTRAVVALSLLSLAACAAPAEGEDTKSTSSDLSGSDPVSSAVAGTCDLTTIQGLDEQLVGEIQCLQPGALVSISGDPNLTFGPEVFRYLQAPAAEHLKAVVAARGSPLHLNDALRALPEQYVLYHWYLTGRCGIALAASPGNSNHESGLAVDVNDSVGWRSYFDGDGFRWYGSSDPVHYDYVGGGAVVDIKGLSVLAFQKLWNLNHPTDKIGEDSEYGPQTEARLVQSPLGGFPLGTTCVDAGPPAASDAGDAATRANEDGGEPVTPRPGLSDAGKTGAIENSDAPADSGGCAAAPSHTTSKSAMLWALAMGALVLVRRRRTKP